MLAASTAIAIAWIGLPAPSSYQAQMMLLGGFILLGWILMRRNLRARRRGRREAAEWKQQEQQVKSRDAASVPLGDAPVEVLRWQAAMFDLQRELKAELETKISVVQAMIQLADQRIATLERLDRSATDRPAVEQAKPPA